MLQGHKNNRQLIYTKMGTTIPQIFTSLTVVFVIVFRSILPIVDALEEANTVKECQFDVDGQETCLDQQLTGDNDIWWDESDLDDIDPRILPSKVVGMSCEDEDTACGYFRSIGECMSNPSYMNLACRISCGLCKADDPTWPKEGDVGVQQVIPEDLPMDFREEVLDIMRESRRYLYEEVLVEGGYIRFEEVRQDCTNHHEMCSVWTNYDECDNNRAYMQSNCRLACQLCKQHPKYLHGMYF